MLIALVGPDGAGKTSVAREIERQATERELTFGYIHFLPARGSLQPSVPADAPPPPKRPPLDHVTLTAQMLSVVRVTRNLLRFWYGYLRFVRPTAKAHGTLIVADRWMFNYVGQPFSVAFYLPAWCGRLAVRCAPRPDLAILLTGDPDVIAARKQELTPEQIASEIAAWRTLPLGNRLLELDTTPLPDAIAAQIVDEAVRRSRR